ncbi:MAG: Ig-like domain-containing protein, partial [Candidatus Poribacteria bacterium]|nr:Ig-like domain-containing protein [Candidatus Poribacteria bacterium]
METVRLIEKSILTKISIQSSVSALTADGESTTEIKLEIFDQDGSGVADQRINIEPDLGRLSLIEDHQNGIYTAIYTAGMQVGQENLVARTSNGQMATVQIELTEPLTPATITVTASPLSLPADGEATSQLQVSVLHQQGSGLAEQKITLDATLGQVSSLQDQQDGTYIAT